MDGSCIAQIFPSRKLNALLAHTIHANIHTDINKIYTHTHTHTLIMVLLDLWKCHFNPFQCVNPGEGLCPGKEVVPLKAKKL